MSTSVTIPGGTAFFRDPADMRERHRRVIRTAFAPMAGAFEKVPRDIAERAVGEGDAAQAARQQAGAIVAAAMARTRLDANALLEMRDAVIVALLESWTLRDPLPTMETLGDLPPDLYDALSEGAEPLTEAAYAVALPTSFEPTGPKEPDSPFVGSRGSGTRSKASRRTSPSTRSSRSAGGSSTTAVSTRA